MKIQKQNIESIAEKIHLFFECLKYLFSVNFCPFKYIKYVALRNRYVEMQLNCNRKSKISHIANVNRQ